MVQRVVNDDTSEVGLYCHLQRHVNKEQVQDRFAEHFEAALQSLADGRLSKKGCTKRYDKILERIGCLIEK